jgi:ADP-ribose pyrophosphatase YjhB (NUDIX family)
MAKKKFPGGTQVGALPWRISEGGMREVMLLTSRGTHRWVIPKGWPVKGLKATEAASQAAGKEAGLVGQVVGKRALGAYHYEQRLPWGAELCQVRVFLLRVERQLPDWPDRNTRETRWFDANAAAELVEEGGLAEIIANFAGSYVRFIAYHDA